MDDYISISTLNDFIFCPYSIYLHNVYMETDEGLYHATPQTRGKIAHETIDNKKADYINATMDIGYTFLFNFIECFVRMFGFDIYVGVYHRLWFKRKSLICDLMEPFRCIIDRTIRTAINKKQFSENDFEKHKGEYRLKLENNKKYTQVFFNSLVPFKSEIFKYVQSYYRCFMGNKDISMYPKFCLQ